jgi:hypothetical protein
VHARDTLPAVTPGPRAYVVNVDASTGKGIHWVAALDTGDRQGGQRAFNDPLGRHGRAQRAVLARLQPHVWADDDPEQRPEQTDCGVRALVALAIGLRHGREAFLAL